MTEINSQVNRKICLAPMMDYTDRHFRYLLRLVSKNMLLYTEMVHCGAILFGDRDRFLQFNQVEMPLALQLGGNQPDQLAQCVLIAQEYGYSEVNLNLGCPSDRVQSGHFGACLMADSVRVGECIAAMCEAVTIPITIKNRTGIDDYDSYEFLANFVDSASNQGCKTFLIHARKAWLKGLSPKQNREIPALDYDKVYQIKADFPELEIIINGGINNYPQIDKHLLQVDGVMIGRAAYADPCYWRQLDQRYFDGQLNNQTQERFVIQYCSYIQSQLDQGVYLKHMAKHLLNIFNNLPGAKSWRRYLSEHIHNRGAGVEVIEQALEIRKLKICA